MKPAKAFAAALLTGAALTAGITAASPAWAEVDACGLGANVPNSSLQGTGSRSDCSGTVTLTVRVAKDISFWPDTIVGEVSQNNFSNGSLTANGSCDGAGSYYTWTLSSSGNEIESGRVGRC